MTVGLLSVWGKSQLVVEIHFVRFPNEFGNLTVRFPSEFGNLMTETFGVGFVILAFIINGGKGRPHLKKNVFFRALPE